MSLAKSVEAIEGLLRSGQAEEAARQCRRLRKSHPKVEALLKLEGMALFLLGRPAEAVRALGPFCAKVPGDIGALVFLGNSQQAAGDPRAAAAAFRKALTLAPNAAQIHYNLGNALWDSGDKAGAAEAYGAACALTPGYAKAQGGLGMALAALGRHEEALAAYDLALALEPSDPRVHTNRGSALQAMGRFAEATEAHLRAVALKPDFAEAFANLGNAYQDMAKLDEALAAYGQSVELDPGQAQSLNSLGTALFAAGRQAEAAQRYEAALALAPRDERIHRNILAAAMYRDDLDEEGRVAIRARYGKTFAAKPQPSPPRRGGAEIRLGFISSDLRRHPVALNLLPVLLRMDRAAFRLHFYANVTKPDEVTDQFRDLGDGWRDIRGVGDEEVARQIREDGIDILVSLAGQLDDNRPNICAWRAAPIQISLHDAATSGLDEMDYIIGDAALLPRGGIERFTERGLRLPRFYVLDYPSDQPPLRDPAPAPGAVYGCFNNPAKITPTVLEAWGRVLAARPDARLILKYQERYASACVRDNVTQRLVEAGALPRQLTLLTEGEPRAALLDRYNDMDLALDPFPFCGSTTSFQALSMGLPVLTLPQDSMVSRWTLSMLRDLGLEDELAAASIDDYVARAIAIGDARAQWRARRPEILERVMASPMIRPERWARHWQRLLRALWRRHLAGSTET